MGRSFKSFSPQQFGAHTLEALWEDMPVDVREEIVGHEKRNSVWRYLPRDLKEKVGKWHEEHPNKHFPEK